MKRPTSKRPAALGDAEEVDAATAAILADFDPSGATHMWAARRQGLRELARWLRAHRRAPEGIPDAEANQWRRQRRKCVLHLAQARSAIMTRDEARADAESKKANRVYLGLLLSVKNELLRRPGRQARAAASKDRPGARDLMRAAVVALMQREKATGVTFKKFLEHWERGPRSGLSIEWKDPEHASFVVKNEDGGMRPRDYTFSTLNKMWAEVPDYR